jgi:hypothetical protein
MGWGRILVWALSALFSMGATAVTARAEWLEAETSHFKIRSDTDEATIKQAGRELEMLDAALWSLTGAPVKPPPGEKLVFYILDTVEHMQELAKRGDNYLAFFTQHAGEAMAVTAFKSSHLGSSYDYRVSLYHEYAHYFMSRYMGVVQPTWYREGFAGVVESVEFPSRSTVKIGTVPVDQKWILSEGTWIRAQDLFGLDVSNIKEEYLNHFYAQGWLAAHYSVIGGLRADEFGRYFKSVTGGTLASDPLAGFAGGSEGLTKDLRTYAESKSFATREITVPEVTDLAIAIRSLGESEIALDDVLLRSMGASSLDDTDALLVELQGLRKRYPDDDVINLRLAEMAFAMDDLTLARTEVNALLAHPTPPPKAIALDGLLLMKYALNDAPIPQIDAVLAKSKARIGTALKQAPNDPFILLAMFRAYEADADDVPPEGFAYLKRAIEADPTDIELRERLAEQMATIGNVRGAADALRPVANLPHPTEDVLKARACLKRYEENLRAGNTRPGVCIVVMRPG